ncbi:MAG: outer membrane lipoprotein carrier protein LolA [Desulforhopalus sp.]|nr:outer membrane lipoprotein carrier protein LolA [Desulforhopalus sp.]
MRRVNSPSFLSRLAVAILSGWVLLLVAGVPPVFAAEAEELQSFLTEIQAASDKVRSFSSEFVQERRLALFAEPVIFRGSLVVVRPDRLRWEFISPVPSVLIFRGDRGIRCNDKAPPVHFDLGADPIMRAVAEQLWLWLGGDYSRLNATYQMEKAGPVSLRISPKDQAMLEYITSITITFNKTSKQPEKVEIVDPGGDTTVISFHSYVLNSKTPDVLFALCGTNE